MSKKVWIIIAVVVVLIIGAIVGGVVLITNLVNKTKDPITVSKFESIMEDADFEVVSAKDQFENYDEIEDVKIAIQEDGDYQIEFYVIDNESNADKFFESNKEIFEKNSGSKETRVQTSFKNGELFKLTVNDEYMVLSRIEDTVIYLKVDSEYKDSVDSILKKLGY